MNLLSFFSDLDTIVFTIVFLIVVVFFLRDFKITSMRSWVVLIGLTALGGLTVWSVWRRKNLLKEFGEREERLRKLEAEYDRLKAEGKITAAALEKAKAELAAEKNAAAAATLQADENLAASLVDVRNKNFKSTDAEYFDQLEKKGINLR